MNGTRTRRSYRAAAAAGAGFALLLAGCSSGGGGDDDSTAEPSADCADFESYGDLNGKTVSIYTGIVTPGGRPTSTRSSRSRSAPAPPSSTRATRRSRRRSWCARRRATRRTSPSSRSPACSPSWSPPARSSRPRRDRRGQRRQVLGPGLEGVRHGRRQVLRGPAGRQREVAGLVLAEASSRRTATRSRPRSTSSRRCPTRSRTRARSRGARASRSGDATGWPVTDWMEDFMLRTVRPGGLRQVGQRTRSRSTREVRPRRSTRSVTYLKNDTYVNGGLGDVKSIATTTFQDAGLPILEGQLLAAPPGELLRGQLAGGHEGRRGR